MLGHVLFVLLVGVPVCRGLVFSYYYDPEEVDDEADFSDSYNDEIQAPPGLTTVTEPSTRIRKRQLEKLRALKPEESFDVKGALNSIFHGKNEAADDRPVVLSVVTDSYDYLENSNVLKDKTVETKIPRERIVKWLSTVQIQDWSPAADTDENLGETTGQAEADPASDTYKLNHGYATNSRIFFYDIHKPDAPRYSRKNDIIAQIRKIVPIFEGDVTRSSPVDALQSHDVQTVTTADYTDVTQDISMVYLQETTIYSNSEVQAEVRKLVPHWNLTYNLTQHEAPSNGQQRNPSDNIPHQKLSDNVQHWNPDDIPHHDPASKVRYWHPSDSVPPQKPSDTVLPDNPSEVAQHQNPPYNIQHRNASDRVLPLNRSSNVYHWNSADDVKDQSPPSNVDHWSPSDKLLNYKHSNNVKQSKSSNSVEQSPPSNVGRWSPSDKLLSYKPPNNVKQWKPSDSVQQQYAQVNVEHWSPSDKLLNNKPPNNVKEWKPSDNVKDQSPPSNVEHWSPSDKLLNYKPPNYVKQWKPSDNVKDQSPPSNVEHWSPSDKLLNYKPPNNVKQRKPSDNKEQNPLSNVEHWNPSDKLLNYKPLNNVKPPDSVQQQNAPSNVEHWIPSDKLLNHKPPNNVKQWKPSDQSSPSSVEHWSPSDIIESLNPTSNTQHWNLSKNEQWTSTINDEDWTTQNLTEPDHLWHDYSTDSEKKLTLTTTTIDSNSADTTVEGETHFDSIFNVTEFQKEFTRQNDRTTRTTTVNITVASTTETTTTSPRIDIDAILAIISNLTDDYEWNLTEQFNKSLIEHGFPTCGPLKPTPWGPDGIWTASTGTTLKYYNFANSSVVSKCFVCGLKVTEVPRDAYCADAFAGDFLPLMPVDARSRGRIASYRKYCRFLDTQNFVEDPLEPRAIYGRFTGGCAVRWTDITGIYTQRTCRSRYRPLMGKHFASKRMAKLELALVNVEDGCIISPMATLLPVSRGISLYARFHACVCSTNWCNKAAPTHSLVHCFIIAMIACWLACC